MTDRFDTGTSLQEPEECDSSVCYCNNVTHVTQTSSLDGETVSLLVRVVNLPQEDIKLGHIGDSNFIDTKYNCPSML